MRKCLSLLLISTIFWGCVKQSELDNLQKQIDELKSDKIASVDMQIASIRTSIGNLEAIDSELRGYITTLQEQKEALEQAHEALAGSISEMEQSLSEKEAALHGEISASEANVLAQLQSLRSALEGQISSINTTVGQLQSKDEDLQNQITVLRNYIDGEIRNAKDWVSATFVTLEQYNTTAEIVAGLQTQMTGLNGQLQQLSEIIAARITREDLDAAIAALDESLQTKIAEAVNTCNGAVSTAKEEITAAYTSAIQQAVASCENSMKEWVNNQLTGYYTIARTDSKLDALNTTLSGQLASQKIYLEELNALLKEKLDSTDAAISALIAENTAAIARNAQVISDNTAAISGLRTDLTTARSEITAAYQQAISTAITTLDGQLRGEIATAVNTINTRIDNEIEGVNSTISSLADRVAACEADILSINGEIAQIKADLEKLVARIQSLTYVPRYSDSRATVYFRWNENDELVSEPVTLDFEVHPKSAAAGLVSVWEEAVTLKAVSTITRSVPEFISLPITVLTVEDGVISLQAETGALPTGFFNGETSASACLCISDGSNDRVSEYVTLLAVERAVRVTTLPADVSGATAVFKGSVHHTADISGAETGFLYSSTSATVESLAENGTKVTSDLQGDDTFSKTVSGLQAGNIYYVAYASVDGSLFYGAVRTFNIKTAVDGAVDLGLSVLWGSCNLGATRPEEYGYYYAWGETIPGAWFGGPWYKWGNGEEGGFIKYNTGEQWGTVVDNQTTLLLEDDAAVSELGTPWRMPSENEIKELLENCSWEWTQVNGINGYVVSRGGSSIFLPAAGYREGPGGEYEVSVSGLYLSSMIMPENPLNALCIRFGERSAHFSYYFRTSGYSVRPVYDPDFVPVDHISFTYNTVLNKGESKKITAFISPSNASCQRVIWSSSDPDIATVEPTTGNGIMGLVKGISPGTAVITVTTVDGGKTATCNVTVKPVPDAIDMGLSVKWGSFNLGGTKAEGLGYSGYFVAWGDPLVMGIPKTNFEWDNYFLCEGTSRTLTKYNDDPAYGVVDNLTTLQAGDDVARRQLGGTWRIPTLDEVSELIDNCDWQWIDNSGDDANMSGALLTSLRNGASIFLPADGYMTGTSRGETNIQGMYWTSTLNHADKANCFIFNSLEVKASAEDRQFGLSIRPVCD